MPPILEVIAHYQRSIEQSTDDQTRLLHCLDKLQHLHVTVEHLKSTGVGLTVNKLRKIDGIVGNTARTLIAKWKGMVTAESSEQQQQQQPQETTTLPPTTHSANGNHTNGHNGNDGESLPSAKQRTASKSGDPHRNHNHHHHKSSSQQHSSSTNSGNNADMSSSAAAAAASGSGSSSGHKSHRSSGTGGHSSKDTSLSKTSRDKSNTSGSTHHKSSHKSSSNGGSSTSSSSASKRNHSDAQPPADAATASASSSSARNKDRPLEKKKKTSASAAAAAAVDEIDCSMGTSFADALGMMAPVSARKSASSSSLSAAGAAAVGGGVKASHSAGARHSLGAAASTSSQSRSSSSSSSSSSSVARPSSSKQPSTSSAASGSAAFKKPPTATATPPSLLATHVKLAPLDPELAVSLISNDYRPLPVSQTVMDCVYRSATGAPMSAAAMAAMQVPKTMTDAELGASMSSKNQRTKVYSGVKTGALLNVPSLHEMCIRVLQRNIDALEATGGVPFEILKPVLERASPDQLFTLEDYNPYLIGDTDDLWRQHCQRKFRGQKPTEYESWRDMFSRCREEQEKRLNNLTENIKRTQTVAVPVKQTKITFVDSVVKPPRDVLKKQARFNTDRVPVCTPAARVASLQQSTSNIARPGDARLRVMAGMRDHAQVSARAAPRKAPLMAKTLQHMKGLFKR